MNLFFRFFITFGLSTGLALAQQKDGVQIRCGASKGHGYFFQDDLTNPDGPNWSQDGISTGKIVLVRYGEEWDILFDDSVGASGYRQDGATVVPLISKGSLLSVGAFHSNYADVYTFDFVGRQVAWTSNKLGPIVPKVAVYQANCD